MQNSSHMTDRLSTGRKYNVRLNFSKEIEKLKSRTSSPKIENSGVLTSRPLVHNSEKFQTKPFFMLIQDNDQKEYRKTDSSNNEASSIDEDELDCQSKNYCAIGGNSSHNIGSPKATNLKWSFLESYENKSAIQLKPIIGRNAINVKSRRSSLRDQGNEYDAAWTSKNNGLPSDLKQKLVIRGIMSNMDSFEKVSQNKSKQLSHTHSFFIETQNKESTQIKLNRPSPIESRSLIVQIPNNKVQEISIPYLNSRVHLKTEADDYATKSVRIGTIPSSRTSFKITSHAVYRDIEAKLGHSQSLNMFKRAGLHGKGCIFDSELINVSVKITRLEDSGSNRRLLKVYLGFGNKGQGVIDKFSIKLLSTPNLITVRSSEQSKSYIKPGKQQGVDFVIRIDKMMTISHLEVKFIGQRTNSTAKSSNLLEFNFLVPVTYVLFLEGVRQIQTENLLAAWTFRKELVLQSSGKLKINLEVLQAGVHVLKLLQNSVMTTNSYPELSLEYCETYFAMVETNNLSEFLYLRFDCYPNTNELVIKTSSAAEHDEKAAFLIQTLLFLIGP